MKAIEVFDDEATYTQSAFKRVKKFSNVLACREAPLLGRAVDLVFIRGTIVITVEFKLRDWRKGIKQARDHQIASDYSYLCMPRREITEALRGELEKYGIGLYFFEERDAWPFYKVIPAKRPKYKWKTARKNLWDYIIDKNTDS